VARTVFVLVYGFNAAERHALKMMFELSRDRATVYMAWREGSARAPSVILVDGSSSSARRGYLDASQQLPSLMPIWVVSDESEVLHAPPGVLEVLRRPIDWQRLVASMDALFLESGGDSASVDLDLDFMDTADTSPDVIESGERILVVDGNRDHRLLLRAALAARNLCELDDTDTVHEARVLLHHHHYAAALISLDGNEDAKWELVNTARNQMASTYLISDDGGWRLAMKAKAAGCAGVLASPFDITPVVRDVAAARGR
jgi:hypothetical protein